MSSAHSSHARIGLWTAAVSRRFYLNLNALETKLQKNSPAQPQNYRDGSQARRATDTGYMLPYEKELHLADHFAFLAHAEDGAEFVSAATIEEDQEPPGFTVRLASNHTPRDDVIEGIQGIIDIVVEHARKGVSSEVESQDRANVRRSQVGIQRSSKADCSRRW
jgi:hypothetical protein